MDPIKRNRRDGERWISVLASRQHGVVAARQLLEGGFSRTQIREWVRKGRLHRIHTGVYSVGHERLTQRGHWMAAVLSGGEAAVLSHRAAGAHHGILRWRGVIEVTVPKARRSNDRVLCHRSALPADEVAVLEDIPVTTVARTLLDLAAVLDRRRLELALNEAEAPRHAGPLSVPDLIARHPRRHGVATLRSILDQNRVGLTITKSELEERFLRFIRRSGLPEPELNAAIHLGDHFVEADCLWRRERLIVELDGAEVHGRALSRRLDPGRDRRLTLAGYRVIHVNWHQLHAAPERAALAGDLRTALG